MFPFEGLVSFFVPYLIDLGVRNRGLLMLIALCAHSLKVAFPVASRASFADSRAFTESMLQDTAARATTRKKLSWAQSWSTFHARSPLLAFDDGCNFTGDWLLSCLRMNEGFHGFVTCSCFDGLLQRPVVCDCEIGEIAVAEIKNEMRTQLVLIDVFVSGELRQADVKVLRRLIRFLFTTQQLLLIERRIGCRFKVTIDVADQVTEWRS